MGDRSVKIRLTAEAKSLIAELKASASAAEELKTSTTKVDRELKEMQQRADKAGTSLLKLAADGKIAGEGLKAADKQLADLNRDLAKMGSAQVGGSKGVAASLTAQIKDAEAELKKLATEFKNTGSASSLSGFKNAEKELKNLKNLLVDVERIGGSNGKGFFSNLISSGQGALDQQLAKGFELSLTNPYVLGVIAAAAPVAGAAIGGAVLAGIGTVGIGAGIAGQLHDPAVKAAAAGLGKEVGAGFKDATAAFRGPTIVAIRDIGVEFQKLKPGLTAMFTALAPRLHDLTTGVTGFADALIPAFEKAAVAAGPLISDLGTDLPRIGAALGNVFTTIARNADEARGGLQLLTNTIDLTLQSASTGIVIMSKLYDAMKLTGLGVGLLSAQKDKDTAASKDNAAAAEAVAAADAKAAAALITVGNAMNETDPVKAASEWGALETRFTTLAKSSDTLAQAMSDAVFNSLMSVDRANLSVSKSLLDVSDALEKNKNSLDIHKQAGIADRTAILDAVAANIQQYDSLIQSGIGADDAAKAYDANTAALRKQLSAAGLTTKQINELIGKYGAVPDKVNTAIATQGLTDAINNLTDLLSLINHIPRTRTVTIKTNFDINNPGAVYNSQVPKYHQYGGIEIPAAQGLSYGIYPASNPPLIKFAEPQTGGETLIPNRGIPAARGLALADYAASNYGGRVVGGWSGSGPMDVRVWLTMDNSSVVKVVRAEVKNSGGGNVQVALGKSGR